MKRAIVAAIGIALLASACSKVVQITPEAATEQARLAQTPATADADATPAADDTIRAGVWVRVQGAGDCLNVRAHASADDERIAINYCRPDGTEAYVAAGPEENDDGRWWFLAGLGWALEEFLVFDRAEDLAQRVVPELAGLGTIGFTGPDGALWTMSADGSDRRRVEPLKDIQHDPAQGVYVSHPVWSPDGSAAIVQMSVQMPERWAFTVFVVDRFGNAVYEFQDAIEASWSPDGTRLAMLRDAASGEAGGVVATPAVVDLSTNAVAEIGPTQFYETGPVWSPAGDRLAYEDADGVHVVGADGTGDTVLPVAGARPGWSPDGTRLTINTFGDECLGYVVYNIEAGSSDLCVPQPEGDGRRGGRGGSAADGRTVWSPDGARFAYHTEWAVANESGVYVVDATTGEQTLLLGWQAVVSGFAPDGRHVLFSTRGADVVANMIWVGDVETGEVVLLAEGTAPVWLDAD